MSAQIPFDDKTLIIGMTPEEVEKIVGKPNDIIKHSSEHWYFKNKYLKFENGKLHRIDFDNFEEFQKARKEKKFLDKFNPLINATFSSFINRLKKKQTNRNSKKRF